MSKVKYWVKKSIAMRKKRQAIKLRIKEVQEQYDNLPEKIELTKTQEKEIIDFYKKLTGIKVPLIWHKYYYSKTGRYAKEYLPESLYRYDLVGRANAFDYRNAYVDKNMLEVFLPGIRFPKPVVKNMNGYFYVNGQPVTEAEAARHIHNIDNVIIKPTLQRHGEGVRKLKVENGITNIDGKTVEQMFKVYKKNFIIQECVRQHERIAALNPSSLNTIRIVTYRSGMEIIVLFSSIRIGRMGCEVDNLASGGLSVVVHPDGTLGKTAYTLNNESSREKTDTGITLDGYLLPGFDKAIELVKNLHFKLPFFDIVGWDISVDQEEEPVVIEWNARTELSQLAYGPAFGENTERIIKELWPRENTRNPFW